MSSETAQVATPLRFLMRSMRTDPRPRILSVIRDNAGQWRMDLRGGSESDKHLHVKLSADISTCRVDLMRLPPQWAFACDPQAITDSLSKHCAALDEKFAAEPYPYLGEKGDVSRMMRDMQKSFTAECGQSAYPGEWLPAEDATLQDWANWAARQTGAYWSGDAPAVEALFPILLDAHGIALRHSEWEVAAGLQDALRKLHAGSSAEAEESFDAAAEQLLRKGGKAALEWRSSMREPNWDRPGTPRYEDLQPQPNEIDTSGVSFDMIKQFDVPTPVLLTINTAEGWATAGGWSTKSHAALSMTALETINEELVEESRQAYATEHPGPPDLGREPF